MVIGLLELQFHIPNNHSLKGKRQVLQGLKKRIRQRFNVSVSETGTQDKWQRVTLSVACVGTDRAGVSRTLNHLADFAGEDREAALLDVSMEFL